MTTTVQGRLALAETLGWLNITLVANTQGGVTAALALDWDPA
jgi:hypothetical protein